MNSIILTGGGTAGHTFGNVALLPKLRKEFDQIIYIGSENGVERKIIENFKDVKYIPIPTAKFIRKFTLKNLAIPFVLFKAIKRCKEIIDEFKPKIIFSKGGYVSVPVVLAGHKKHIPIVLHESDISLGLANKICKNKADVICTSFEPLSEKLFNGIYTGSPIREELFSGNKNQTLKMFQIPQGIPVLLVLGGSLGAQSLNNLVWDNLDFLCSRFFVVHLTGRDKAKKISHKNYAELEFSNDMKNLYSIADFALTRGGSNVLFELLALKIPMLISPLVKQSRGEQKENARYFTQKGFALTLEKEEKNELEKQINKLINSKEQILENMNKYSQKNSIDLILNQINKFKIK